MAAETEHSREWQSAVCKYLVVELVQEGTEEDKGIVLSTDLSQPPALLMAIDASGASFLSPTQTTGCRPQFHTGGAGTASRSQRCEQVLV